MNAAGVSGVLDRHRDAALERINSFMLRAVVLEDALNMLHLGNQADIDKKDSEANAAFGEIGNQTVMVRQQLVGQQGRERPKQRKAEKQRQHSRRADSNAINGAGGG